MGILSGKYLKSSILGPRHFKGFTREAGESGTSELFQPDSLGDLELWADFSSSDFLTLDGVDILAILDRAENGSIPEAGTSVLPATFDDDGLNGRGVGIFSTGGLSNGGPRYDAPLTTVASPYTCIFIFYMEPDIETYNGRNIRFGAFNDGWQMVYDETTDLVNWAYNTDTANLTSITAAAGAWHIGLFSYDVAATGQEVVYGFDGTTATYEITSPIVDMSGSGVNIGVHGSSAAANQRMAELFLWRSTLSADQLALVMQHIKVKWDLDW